MADPEVKKRHLLAVHRSIERQGINFRGGNGQEPTEIQEIWSKRLSPMGYHREHVIKTNGHKTNHKPPLNYKADFANPKEMTVIELDGPSHRNWKSKELDKKKTEVLESLGWRVIRIKHN